MTLPDYVREAWGHVMEGPEMVDIMDRLGLSVFNLAGLVRDGDMLPVGMVSCWCSGEVPIPSSVAAALRLMDRGHVPDVVFFAPTDGHYEATVGSMRFTYNLRMGAVACWRDYNLKHLGDVPTLPLACDLCRGYLLSLKERG